MGRFNLTKSLRICSRNVSPILAYERHAAVSSHPTQSKIPIVIAHGLFGSARNWRSLGSELSKRLEANVYCLDLRNHGSSFRSSEMSLSVMAQDVHAFAESVLGSQHPYVFCGHSLGGRVALAGILQDKLEHCVAGVVVDMAPVRYGDARASLPDFKPPRDSVLAYAKEMQTVLHAPEVLDASTSTLSARRAVDSFLAAPIRNPAIRAFLLSNLEVSEENGGVQLRWRCNVDVLVDVIPHLMAEDVAPSLSTTTPSATPMAFFYGTKSDYVTSDAHFSAIHRLFSDVELRPFDAGHWLHAEQPKKFADDMEQFYHRVA